MHCIPYNYTNQSDEERRKVAKKKNNIQTPFSVISHMKLDVLAWYEENIFEKKETFLVDGINGVEL